MKNKIKLCLSPIIVSAVLTPVVCAVSCDSPNWVEPIVMHEITGDWENPTDYEPLPNPEEGWSDNKTVNDEFVQHMSEHPDHFIEDMLWGVSKRYPVWHDMYKQKDDKYLLKLEKCQFGFSEPTFGETFVWVRGVKDTRYDTISFKEEVEIDYITPDTNAKSVIKQKIHIHIEYNDIILNVIPPHLVGLPAPIEPESKIGWSIGVLNELSQTEALWSYVYNTKPWSITYGCTNQITEEMLDDEGNVISELHNTKYYSGLVNDYSGLYDLYVAQADVDPTDSANDRLTREIIVTILNLECQSYLLSMITNKIDVILVEHLWGEVTSGSLTSMIMGFKLIDSVSKVSGGYQPEVDRIYLGERFEGIENGADQPNKITCNEGTELTKNGTLYYMTVNLEKAFPSITSSIWHSFNIEKTSLKLLVDYTIGLTHYTGLEVDVNLHYNTVDIRQEI